MNEKSIFEIGVGVSKLCHEYEKQIDGSLWFDENQKNTIRNNIRNTLSNKNSLISDIDCELLPQLFEGEEFKFVKDKFIIYDICNPKVLKNKFDIVRINNVLKSKVISNFPFNKIDVITNYLSRLLSKNGEIHIINGDKKFAIKNPIDNFEKFRILELLIDDDVLKRNGISKLEKVNSNSGILRWNVEKIDGTKYQILRENSDRIIEMVKKFK